MSEHRYILEPYKGMNTRYRCPGCQHTDKTFTRYVDTSTGEYLPEQYGRCDRESNCGYHKLPPLETKCFFVPFDELHDHSPKSYKIENGGRSMSCSSKEIDYLPKSQVYELCETGCYVSEWYLNSETNKSKPKYIVSDYKYFTKDGKVNIIQNALTVKPPQKAASYISPEIFKASLKNYDENNFVKFLIDLFGSEITGKLISRYFIGTSKHQFKNKGFPDYVSEIGATVFWQIDTQGKIRTGKIMLYNPSTGKRVKEPFNHITWVHKALKLPSFELRQCLYGEHLLKGDLFKPIALVESEKTAIIASVYLPQFIWLATGSLSNLKAEKCSILKGRTVILFPDLKGFDKWTEKAEKISDKIWRTRFVVSDLLETKASEEEKVKGLDLADYLIRFDLGMFRKNEKEDFSTIINNNEKRYGNGTESKNVATEILPIEKANDGAIIVQKLSEPIQPETWDQDITNLQTYFTEIILPTDPVKLNQCSTITDVSKFIESHFETAKGNSNGRIKEIFIDRLQELKQILIKNLN